MMTSVGRLRIGRRVASSGAEPQPETGRKTFIGVAAACVGAATLAASSGADGQSATDQSQTEASQSQDQSASSLPPGMERYDHPVFKDGHLLLWHGAWRDRVKITPKPAAPSRPVQAVAAPAPKPVAAPAAQPVAAPAPQVKTVPAQQSAPAHEFVVLADADDSCVTRLAGEVRRARRPSRRRRRSHHFPGT